MGAGPSHPTPLQDGRRAPLGSTRGRTAARQQQGSYPRIPTSRPPPSRVPYSQSTSGPRSSRPNSTYSSPSSNNYVTTNGSGSSSRRSQGQEHSSNNTDSQPGAFSMRRMSGGRFGTLAAGNTRESTPYTVIVPDNVRSGQQFQVMAGGVHMMVTCPPRAGPGDHVIVMAPRPQSSIRGHPDGRVYLATVPHGVRGGGEFNVQINGRTVTVTCPHGVHSGTQIRIRIPDPPQDIQRPNTNDSTSSRTSLYQTFEVTIPLGIGPGQPFALYANEQRVMVNCPNDARPGQKIRFRLPIELSADQLGAFEIDYNKDGWVRCVGVDLKFYWVRQDKKNKDDPMLESSASKVKNLPRILQENCAFVRQIKRNGPTWVLSFELAKTVALESCVPEADLTFQHISKVSARPFMEKVAWFQEQCNNIRTPWEVEHQKVNIRRSNLLEDSMQAFETIRADQMRERFRFQFIGEEGLDAGGVAREWFQLAAELLFNPDFALFEHSAINQMCLQINANSGIANDDHLLYFHFAGRLLGKALFDGQIVPSHLVSPLYKLLLGWPIAFPDLEHLDHYTHDSLLKLTELEDVSICVLDFSTTVEELGAKRVVPLKADGENIDVTNENLGEYIELMFRNKMIGRVHPQTTAFLVGFYEVIPEALLSIFDFQELELFMCGLPRIDIEDWKRNTMYTGALELMKAQHKVAKWWWELLEEFTAEQRARLLQFVTGTSGVPSQGFAYLQGNDGNIRKFTILGTPISTQGFRPHSTTAGNAVLPLEPTPAIPIDHENNCDSGGKDAEAPQQLNLSVAPVKEHQSNRSPLKRKYEDITKCTALRVLYVDLGLQGKTHSLQKFGERLVAASEGRLHGERKLIVDVCTVAMSAAFDVCYRHVPYEVIFLSEALGGGISGGDLSVYFRKSGVKSKIILVAEDPESIQFGAMLNSGINAIIRRPRIVERQRSQWYLAPLFDCLSEVLSMDSHSCGLLATQQIMGQNRKGD